MAGRAGGGRGVQDISPALVLSDLAPAPVLLFRGSERALADRALAYLRTQIRQRDPEVEVVEADASSCPPGQLSVWTSPSLFGDRRLIILLGVEEAGVELTDELLQTIANPPDDAIMALYHRGGVKGKKIVDAVKRAGFPIWATEPLKFPRERLALVADEVANLNAKAPRECLQMLVDAVGDDLHELLGTTRRLVHDGGGVITREAVDAHFAGRVDTGGFDVADAMAAGDGPRAVVLARRAFESGVAPVLVVAALAYQLRSLAKVSVPGLSGPSLGMRPAAEKQARRNLRHWSAESLGAAICVVARADADVKGASKDPEGAVERCLIEISRRNAAR